jgi:ketosteroid isomerase-like protein
MQALPDPKFDLAVADYFRHVSERDLEAWMGLFGDSAILHDPVDSLPAEGAAAIREAWKALTAPFESLQFTPDLRLFSESGAAVKWTGKAVAADGAQTNFEGITVFEFDDAGAIEAVVSYWDPAAVLIELAGEAETTPKLDA